MPQVTCPSCNQALNVPDSMVGKHVRCPLCNNSFHAAGRPGEEPPVAETAGSYPPRGRERDADDSDDYDRPRSRPPARRDYEEYDGDGDYRRSNAPLNTARRSSAAIWMLIAGVVDLMVAVTFFIFIFTVDRRRPPPAEALLITSVLVLVFYIVPLIFLFVAAGVMRNPRANGLVITGSVMAFILALELLIMTGLFAIFTVLMVNMRRGFNDGPPEVTPVVFVLSLAGLAMTITAGIKGLIAISESPRPRSDYY